MHRRILPTPVSKHSLLYTQFIILDCIYKKHMFGRKEGKNEGTKEGREREKKKKEKKERKSWLLV